MANLKIIKEEVSNLKENLEALEYDDPSMNKLHQRVYDLKMSLLNVDERIKEINFFSRKDLQESERLLELKTSYLMELRSLEMVL